ncbi:MAG TPA: CHRD domain-containing protein [Rubrobacter sp.]|nr:CHRD domain-containing protein [Rubrobacter sp.]
MKGRRLFLSLVLAALVALALAGAASAARLDGADHGGRPLSTTMTGAAEVPGPGDPDGSGTAKLTFNLGREEVCWEITAQDLTLPATAAHIHVGAAGTAPANNVVVTLSAPDASGFTSGCTTVERELAEDILDNPENYYVNVHNSDFPGGAIRGQLS